MYLRFQFCTKSIKNRKNALNCLPTENKCKSCSLIFFHLNSLSSFTHTLQEKITNIQISLSCQLLLPFSPLTFFLLLQNLYNQLYSISNGTLWRSLGCLDDLLSFFSFPCLCLSLAFLKWRSCLVLVPKGEKERPRPRRQAIKKQSQLTFLFSVNVLSPFLTFSLLYFCSTLSARVILTSVVQEP